MNRLTLMTAIFAMLPLRVYSEFVPPPTVIPKKTPSASQKSPFVEPPKPAPKTETVETGEEVKTPSVIEVFKQRSTSYYLTLGLGAAAGKGMNSQSYLYWVMSSRLAARITSDLYAEGGVDHLGYNALLLGVRYFHEFPGSKWGAIGGLSGAYMLPRTSYDEETSGLQIDPRAGSKFSTLYFAPSAGVYYIKSASLRLKAEMVGYVAPSRILVTFLSGVISYF